YFGGITFAPVEKTRAMISLLSGSPGTIGVCPDRVGFVASSRMSRRMSALRALRSGPWQRKQVSDMIGRTSRLKLIRSGGEAATAVSVQMAAAAPHTAWRMRTLIHPQTTVEQSAVADDGQSAVAVAGRPRVVP